MPRYIDCEIENYEAFGLFIGCYIQKNCQVLKRDTLKNGNVVNKCLESLELFQNKFNSEFTIENYEVHFNLKIGILDRSNHKKTFLRTPTSFLKCAILEKWSDSDCGIRLLYNVTNTDVLRWLPSVTSISFKCLQYLYALPDIEFKAANINQIKEHIQANINIYYQENNKYLEIYAPTPKYSTTIQLSIVSSNLIK